jgi:hypothetical protein
MRFRTVRTPLFAGFLIFTAGLVGLATLRPSDDTRAIVFASLAGLGFGGPLVLIVAAVQLSTPHHLIATATAVTTSARAVGATVFTAIYSAAFGDEIAKKLPNGIIKAVTQAGLAAERIPEFMQAFLGKDTAALSAIPGVNSGVIEAATEAMKVAYADSVRVVYYIGIAFGATACVACFFLDDLRGTMNYRVDAPVEHLEAKRPSARD